MLAPFSTERAMQGNEFYFLVMVCGIFVAFGAGLAVNYIQYRRWLKQPVSNR
jgi:hypothetical protein